MKKVQLLFGIHDHQPVGNFDHVFRMAFDRCYRPFLDVFSRFPAVKASIHTSGSLLSKVAYDVQNVSGAATFVLTVLVRDSIAVIGLLAWLFYLNWKLTLITLAIAPPIALTVRLIAARLRHMAREDEGLTGHRHEGPMIPSHGPA